MMPSSAVRFSVIIPTLNAGVMFRQLLNALRMQQGASTPEIIVVDSGSTDQTVATAIECDARVIAVPAAGFSHSAARMAGARTASGDYLLFTVQDALPSSLAWLREMFEALQRFGATAISCAEYPRSDADLFYRAASWNHDRFMGVRDSDRVMRLPLVETPMALRQNAQLSNTACLVHRDIFSRYGFRGSYAEDLDLGLRLIRDGYTLGLLGTTRVIHSHNRPASYHFKRGYVDTLTLRQLFSDAEPVHRPLPALMAEIAASRRALDDLVHETLDGLRLPCTLADLTSRVAADLATRSAAISDTPLPVVSDQYVDQPLASLLNALVEQCGDRPSDDEAGAILSAVSGMSGMVLEYMSDSYDVISRDELAEFTHALYKGWALQAGGQLAAHVSGGGGPTAESHVWLHTALSHEV